jgi:quercetin dioxygenase-like cupin family protein
VPAPRQRLRRVAGACKQVADADDEVAEHIVRAPTGVDLDRRTSERRRRSSPNLTTREPTMHQPQQSASHPLALAAAIAAAFVMTSAAHAGACPADKVVADGQGQKMSNAAAKDVKDVVRATTDLAGEPIGVKGRQFRLRQLDIGPGGIVPWHSHDNRPAMIYVVSGEVIEYASNCAVPITHRAGDVAPEKKGTSHWWQNTGAQPAVLISVDLFPVADRKMEHMM